MAKAKDKPKTKAEKLDDLRAWLDQTAWKWNKGLEESQALRDVLVTMGETFEESFPIMVIEKNILPCISSHGNVIYGSFIYNSQ